MPSSTIEPLELRRLLSGTLSESEPNDTFAHADVIPRQLGQTVEVRGRISTSGDRDWFKIKLKAGDVLGVAINGAALDQAGLDPNLRLVDSAGRLVIENTGPGFNSGDNMPEESPLPRADRDRYMAEFQRVMPEAGTYYLEVAHFVGGGGDVGGYDMNVVVARPGMESQPRGAKQVVFIDFDGATVDYDEFRDDQVSGSQRFAPLVKSLGDWGLTKGDLNAVINETLKRLRVKLSTFIRANGANGDFDASGKPGEFDIEIRNSRDHRDRFRRDPYTARIVIGGSDNPILSNEYIGQASVIDPGNFKFDDQAVIATKFVGDLLAAFERAPGASVIDFAAEYLAVLAAHEFGHLAGNFHTQYSDAGAFEEPVTLMDKLIYVPLGPDFVFGTNDDISMQFGGPDAYNAEEYFAGTQDTLNTVAFGLSTGTRRGRHHDDADGRDWRLNDRDDDEDRRRTSVAAILG